MKALNGLSPFLRRIEVYNLDKFHGNRNDVLWQYLHVLDVSISLLLFVLFNVMVFWHSKDEHYRMNSPSMPTFLVGTQTVTSFIALLMNNRKMSATIDHLRSTIAQSKPKIKKFDSGRFCFSFEWFLDDGNSLKSIGVYHGIEKVHALITRLIFNLPAVTCTVIYTLTAIQPISYIAFDYPNPEHWQLPLSIQ